MRALGPAADERTVRTADTLVALWVVVWLVVAVWTGVTLWQASAVGDSVQQSASALRSAGQGLQGLDPVPVVGDDVAAIGDDVVATADDVTSRGDAVRGQLRRLAVLLGLSVAGIPSAPVAGLYVPLRLSRRREIQDIRRSLSDPAAVSSLDAVLATRALHTLPFSRLATLSDDPAGDLARGQVRALADAELARLGVRRPREH